jgi:hypothetical protein
LFEDPLFSVKVRSKTSFFEFVSMSALHAENAHIDEQLAKAREGVYTFLFKEE